MLGQKCGVCHMAAFIRENMVNYSLRKSGLLRLMFRTFLFLDIVLFYSEQVIDTFSLKVDPIHSYPLSKPSRRASTFAR